jgi:hypothetical protein
VLYAALAACSGGDRDNARIDTVEPSVVSTRASTTVSLSGAGFYEHVTANLDDDCPPMSSGAWLVTVGPEEFDENTVERLSSSELAFEFPAGVSPGDYDVTAFSPEGMSVPAPIALSVLDDEDLVIHLEDLPGGDGTPIDGAVLVTTEVLDVYAVGRDADGGFMFDVPVMWSTDGAAAIDLAVHADGHAIVTASTVGMGALIATHPIYDDVTATVHVVECMTDTDCADPCRSGNTCTAEVCIQAPVDLDADGDGAFDDACPGGDDCDDDPAQCGAGCFPGNPAPDVVDGFDQDCDGMIDETTDLTPPVITLLGPNPAYVAQDAPYVDLGATAFDAEAGDLTASIVVVSTVDTSTLGSYLVTYDVMDPGGNPAVQVTRDVHVIFDCNDVVVATRPLDQNAQVIDASTYFVVCSFAQLEEVGTDPTDTGLDAAYVLGADIDASPTADLMYNAGAGWDPIGECVAACGGADEAPFTGIFDGGHHAISDLYVDRPGTNGIGMFGNALDAQISNLDMVNVDVTGDGNVGGLLGNASGGTVVARCSAEGKVEGVSRTGGLIGSLGASAVEDSFAQADVQGNNRIGGLIGNVTNSTTHRCDAARSATATSRVGGLIGHSSGFGTIVNDSFVAVAVSGNTSNADEVGAVLGSSFGITDTELYYDSAQVVVNAGGGALQTGIGTGIDVGGVDPADYFFATPNPPLSAWDFNSVWAASGSDYPTLQ